MINAEIYSLSEGGLSLIQPQTRHRSLYAVGDNPNPNSEALPETREWKINLNGPLGPFVKVKIEVLWSNGRTCGYRLVDADQSLASLLNIFRSQLNRQDSILLPTAIAA